MTIKPDAYEQLTLELINQARMDPGGEFARLITNAGTSTAVQPNITNAIQQFNVNMTVLQQQFNGLTAAAPLAWSDQLSQSATTHSQLMINFNQQSHNLPGEPNLLQRVQNAGYQVQSIGENIFLFGEDALYSHAAFFIDWGNGPNGIQSPPGHRNSIMNANYNEIGIGVIPENNPATQAGPNSITHHIGSSFNYTPKLLGVVINDMDNDDFYDIGEGLGGVTVTAQGAGGTFTTQTWASGGYQLDLANGTYTVTFSGNGVNRTSNVTIAGSNVKLDAESGGAPPPPATLEQLFAANTNTAQGLSSAYQILLGGVPNQAGYRSLIETAVATNFGAGQGPVFNVENIYINLFNNLVQGNQTALAQFNTIATGTTITEKVTAIYQAIIPPSKQTPEGLAFITRPEGIAFYQSVAAERGVAGADGAAIVAMASLMQIAVNENIGVGNAVRDLTQAVAGGSHALPATGATFTPIETADGTAFDADDAAAIARVATLTAPEPFIYVDNTDGASLEAAQTTALIGTGSDLGDAA